jgi:hydroxyacylglutathione hydrolase
MTDAMGIIIHSLVLGPLENNTYLIADKHTRQAAVIDPSFGSEKVVEKLQEHDYRLAEIWLTHAHFDHIAGVQRLQAAFGNDVPVGLHPSDHPLWNRGGDAAMFGFNLKPGPVPQIAFRHGQTLRLGDSSIEIRHTPGHSPGHVVFYWHDGAVVFCGDLIFQMGMGRTDLPNGNHATLLESIQTQILTLPPHTRLLSGHGPETMVEAELSSNPYIRGN